MNEHDRTAGLRALHRDRAVFPGAPAVHQRVSEIRFDDIPQQRGWLPPLPRFRSMFSATKFVVAGVIVALFGGFLLLGQPFDQQVGNVPGQRPMTGRWPPPRSRCGWRPAPVTRARPL